MIDHKPLGRDFVHMQLTIDIPDRQAQRLGLGREGLERLIGRLLQQMPNLELLEEVTEF